MEEVDLQSLFGLQVTWYSLAETPPPPPPPHSLFIGSWDSYTRVLLVSKDRRHLFVTSVADPDPRLGAFLTPGSGIRDTGTRMGESHHPDPGSGMNNPDHIF
jgi:hypothetical protein